MKLPETPDRGSILDASWGRQVVDYLRALTPRGPGVSTTGGGTTIIGGGGGRARNRITGSTIPPFKLTGFIESEAAYIRVYPGLVDNIVPKIGGDSLLALIGNPPAPPKIAVSGAVGVLWLDCTIDAAGTMTNCVVGTGATMPTDDDNTVAVRHVYRTLGSFTSADGKFTGVWSSLQTNQTHKRCGNNTTWGQA